MMRRLMFYMGLAWLLVMPLVAVAAPMNFTVQMSEAVVVDITGGTPAISLTIGDKARAAAYSSGSGTSALTFSYAPQAGDYDADGIVIASPIALNNGTIKDSAGNNAVLAFTAPDTSGVKVDYPALKMDFAGNGYSLNGTSYNNFSSFLSAAGGAFSRNSVATYFDASGVLQTASANTARFDHDPVTHAAKGILIEEGRTNSIANSTMVGGSTGVWPTNWSGSGNNGLAASVVGTGTQNGMAYIDIRVSGTSSGSSGLFYNLRNNGSSPDTIPATNGTSWTHSTYVSLVAGSTANLISVTLNAAYYVSAGYTGEVFTPVSLKDASATPARYTGTGTLNNAGTTGVLPYYQVNASAGAVVDFTLRFAAPQFEQGAFPTSFIPTSGSVVTRAADDLTIPTTPWFNAAEGTFIAESFGQRNSNQINYGRIVGTSGASNKTFISSGADLGRVETWPGSGGALSTAMSVTLSPTQSGKMAMGWTDSSKTRSITGTGATLATGSYTGDYTTATIRVGAGESGTTNHRNAAIKSIRFYPLRLPDASLQALVQ